MLSAPPRLRREKYLHDWAEAGHISLQTGACTIENRAYLDALRTHPKP